MIGYLATVSSIGNLEAVVVWGALLSATLVSATPLVFASLGGLFSERSGVVNIGLEGMMLMGAFFSVWGADKTGHWTLGVLIGVAAGAATGLLHAFFSVTLRADQIVGGTAINFLALGITGYLFIRIYGERGTPSEGLSTVPDSSLDFLYDIPPDRLGGLPRRCLHEHGHLIWTALAMVFVTWVAVFKTPSGLRLRSVGEHPRAADTVGINVYLTRYAAVTLSGALAGAGGVYLALGFVNSFDQHDSRTRIHRSRCPHLRELATVWRTCRMPSVRVLERARDQPAGVLAVGVDLVRGAAVRAYPRCRRRGHRALDSTGCYWSSVRQAVAAWGRAAQAPPGARSSRGSRRSRRSPWRSTSPASAASTSSCTQASRSRLQPCSASSHSVAGRSRTRGVLSLSGCAGSGPRPCRTRARDRRPVHGRRGSRARSSSTACWSTSARGTRSAVRADRGVWPRPSTLSRCMFDIGSSLRGPDCARSSTSPSSRSAQVRPKYLRALEDERFDILPAPTYVRGFLRSYAESLGLDGQPFVDEYNTRFAVGDEDAPIRARRVPPPRRDRSGRESRIAVLALFAIAVATALVIAAWRFGGRRVRRVPGLASPGAGQATHSPSSAAQRTRLAVTAVSGGSWMEVRAGSSGGKLLYSGTLERGQRKTFEGVRLQLALAEPQNVAVRLNGNRVSLPVGTTFVVTPRRIVRATS